MPGGPRGVLDASCVIRASPAQAGIAALSPSYLTGGDPAGHCGRSLLVLACVCPVPEASEHACPLDAGRQPPQGPWVLLVLQ